MQMALAKIHSMKGYSWQMLQFPGDAQGPDPGDPKSPHRWAASFFRTECAPNSTSATAPIMVRFSSPSGHPGPALPYFEQDLAAFLLIRSDYAWPLCVASQAPFTVSRMETHNDAVAAPPTPC